MFSGIGKGTNQLDACRRYAPSSVAEVLIVEIRTWSDAYSIQEQIVRIVSMICRRGPIVAGTTSIVGRRATGAAGVEEVSRIFAPPIRSFSGRLIRSRTTHIHIKFSISITSIVPYRYTPSFRTDGCSVMVSTGIVCSISYYCMPGVVVTVAVSIYVGVSGVCCSLASVIVIVSWESVAWVITRNSVLTFYVVFGCI